MFIDNIDYPNRILDAIQKNKLVVFAGAGASMGEPTCLPGFGALVDRIAEDTGETKGKNESYEIFLGVLKARGMDVNREAAIILSDNSLKHNALHEAIVDLFPSSDKIKIVTTNYDQMFEQVLKERALPFQVFNSPAVPLGNDITGIIHIHGNVSDPDYMVVTDEDFGRAYLTEGYASRFLVRLFESYMVLFVGYSYSDTILRYLTRAMFRKHSANRFILTSDSDADWKSLGITPIKYPEHDYDALTNSLIKLGTYAKKGLWDWKNRFIEIADAPPKDLTIETEIDYCLESIDRSRVLADYIHGAEWLELLDKKGAFTRCFSDSLPVDEKSILWANWLCDRFVGNDDEKLKHLFAKHGNQYSKMFSEILLRRVIYNDSGLCDDYYRQYMTLLDKYIVDPWLILEGIEIAIKRNLYHLSLHLFKKLFDVSIRLGISKWMQQENIETSHTMAGDYDIVKRAWELMSEKVLPIYAEEIMSFVYMAIEELHYQYAEMGEATDDKEPWNMAMLVIEDREKEYNKGPIHVLNQVFLCAVRSLEDKETVKHYLMKGLYSKSALLRKISLRAIREVLLFSYDEIIDLLCDKEWIWFHDGKEQVFLLAQNAFAKAELEKQNLFLDMIEDGPTEDEDERNQQRQIYDWCEWLQRTNPENERIKSIMQKKQRQYGFEPREHPELSFDFGESSRSYEQSPVTAQEMMDMPFDKLLELLVSFQGDPFDGPTRWGLLKMFSSCIKGNIQWAKVIIDAFCEYRVNNIELWGCLFQGFSEADITIDEALALCVYCRKTIDILPDKKDLANYIWSVLQNGEVQQRFKEYELDIFELSLELWDKRSTREPTSERYIDWAFNTTTGIVLLCWIYMVSYLDNTGIPENYKTQFENALMLSSWEREVVICILAGHFNFFCYRDKEWCFTHFESMLTGDDKKAYICAWEGMVYFSRRIYTETADIIAPIYLKAVKNIKWLEGDAENGFASLFLSLLIFVVDKPTQEYIPEYYKAASEKNIQHFITAIDYQLRALNTEIKTTWWDNWLKRFLENRKNNIPVELSDLECRLLFKLLPKLDFVFDEAVMILCMGKIPSEVDTLFWYELNKEDLVKYHSQSIAKLLITLLRSIHGLSHERSYIENIASNIHGIEEREQKQLQEVLVKHSINVSFYQ